MAKKQNLLFKLTKNEEEFLQKLGVQRQENGDFTLNKTNPENGNGVAEVLVYKECILEEAPALHGNPLICYTYKCGNDEIKVYRPTDYNNFGCREYVTVKKDGVEFSLAGGVHLEFYGLAESESFTPFWQNSDMIKNNVRWSCMMVANGSDWVKVYSEPEIVYGQFLNVGVIVNKNGNKNREDIGCRLTGIRKGDRTAPFNEDAETYEFSEENCYDLLCGAVDDMCGDIPRAKEFFNKVMPLLKDSIRSALKIPFICNYRGMNAQLRSDPAYIGDFDKELKVLDLLEAQYGKPNDQGGIKM